MTDGDDSDLPVFVWTFPVLRRLQTRSGLIDFGQSASTVTSTVEDVKDSSPVRDKINDSLSEDSNDSDGTGEVSEEVEELKDDMLEVEENSELIFGQDDGVEVEMGDDVFIPLRTSIGVGDTVKWVNNDDTVHRVVSTTGEEISSEQIEPGEEFTHTFNTGGVTEYIDSIAGGDTMCGVIIVGDEEFEGTLSCEEDVERELFGNESEDNTRTMGTAVEDKDDMDVGFND